MGRMNSCSMFGYHHLLQKIEKGWHRTEGLRHHPNDAACQHLTWPRRLVAAVSALMPRLALRESRVSRDCKERFFSHTGVVTSYLRGEKPCRCLPTKRLLP